VQAATSSGNEKGIRIGIWKSCFEPRRWLFRGLNAKGGGIEVKIAQINSGRSKIVVPR